MRTRHHTSRIGRDAAVVVSFAVCITISVGRASAAIGRKQFVAGTFVLNESVERQKTREAFNQEFNLFQHPVAGCRVAAETSPGLTTEGMLVLDQALGLVRCVRLDNGLPENIYTYAPSGLDALVSPQSVTASPVTGIRTCRVFILDSGNNRIRRMRYDIGDWPMMSEGDIYSGEGATPYGPLNNPHDIDYCMLVNDGLMSNDMLVVADTGNHRVIGMRPSGEVLWAVGGPEPGSGSNQFRFPYAVTAVAIDDVTKEALVYVADRGNHRIVRLHYVEDTSGSHVTWEKSKSMWDLPGVPISTNSVASDWPGFSGLCDIEVDAGTRNTGVFVLDSTRKMLLQLDWGLNAVLSTFDSFVGTDPSMYDIELYENELTVINTYSSVGGVEFFHFFGTIEEIAASPTRIEVPLEYSIARMTITAGGKLSVWVEDSLGGTISTLCDEIDVFPGLHYEAWDGTNWQGQYVVPGTYTIVARISDAFTGNQFTRTVNVVVGVTPNSRLLITQTEAADPDWSPDGNSIVFSGDGQIKRFDWSSGTVTTLSSGIGEWHRDPAYSTDGTKVAWSVRNSSNDHTLRMMDSDGSNQIGLTFVPPNDYAMDRNPAWDPCGRHLSYLDRRVEGRTVLRGIPMIDGEFEFPPQIVSLAEPFKEVSSHAYSPDGAWLVNNGDARLFTYDTGDWSLTLVETQLDPSAWAAQSVDWSPDGQELLVLYKDWTKLWYGVYGLPAASGTPLPVAGLHELDFLAPGVSWAPDGTKIAAVVRGLGVSNVMAFDFARDPVGAAPVCAVSEPIPMDTVSSSTTLVGSVGDNVSVAISDPPEVLSSLASYRVEWSPTRQPRSWSQQYVEYLALCADGTPACPVSMDAIATWHTGAVPSGDYLLKLVVTDGIDSVAVVRPVVVHHRVLDVSTVGFATIQAAMDVAEAGDTVRVTDGTYMENVVGKSMVSIVAASGAAEIVGQGAGYALKLDDAVGPFLVRGIRFTHAPGYYPSAGGVLVRDSSPTFVDCEFVDCSVQSTYGGAVRVDGASSPGFHECLFAGNRAADGGAVAILGTSSLHPTGSFVNCEFVDNVAVGNGGAVWIQYSMPLDTTQVQPSFLGCKFVGNTASSGSALWVTACHRPFFSGCAFVSNVAASGGGTLAGQESGARIIGSSLAANSAVSGSGTVVKLFGISGVSKSVLIEHSIVARNAPLSAVLSGYAARYRLQSCDLWGNTPEDNDWVLSHANISQDPAFCSLPSDLHLYAFSPCIPAVSGGVQIGAYGVGCVPDAAVSVSPSAAFACPGGDGATLVVTVDLDDATITREIQPVEIVLDTPPFGADTLRAFDEDGDGVLAADAPASSPSFITTVAHSQFGGHGQDALLVRINGFALVSTAFIDVRTPDTANPGGWGADGIVSMSDFAAFGAHYQSPPKPYNYAYDFNNDGLVSSGDFGAFGTHWDHGSTLVAAPAEQKRLRSNAVVSLHFTEEYVTAKKRRLYVDMTLEGFSNIEACVLSFRTGLDILELRDWQSAVSDIGDVLFAPVVRDGLGELFFGILVLDSYDGATTRIGRLVFDVLAGEPLDIGEDGFALVVGDVLVRDRGGNLVASELRSVVSRSLEANIARIYHNRLEQNFPNPFNPSTTIAYSLESRAGVSLIIYDVAGRRVRDLVNEIRNPGVYRVKWNGRNDNGQPVASGVYFYKLVAGSFTDTKKMTVLK